MFVKIRNELIDPPLLVSGTDASVAAYLSLSLLTDVILLEYVCVCVCYFYALSSPLDIYFLDS
jgi:hypothetical protein